MDNPKRIRVQGDSGRCAKQIAKEHTLKREEIPIKEKSDFKTFSNRRSYYRGTCKN